VQQQDKAKEDARRGRLAQGQGKRQGDESEAVDPNKPFSAGELLRKRLALENQRKESMTPYQKYLEPVSDAVDHLRGLLGNILALNSKPRDKGGFRSGKPSIAKIIQSESHGWMQEDDFKVFTRRILPTKRDYKLSFVIDQSGSTAGEPTKRAMEAMVLFMEALEYLDIDYNVIGFSDAPSEYKKFGAGRLDEDARNDLVIKTELGAGSGGTNDKDGIDEAVEKMTVQVGDRKIIIVVTDGQGTNGPIDGVLKKARERGIEVIGIGIGETVQGYVKANYDYAIEVQHAKDLPINWANCLPRNC